MPNFVIREKYVTKESVLFSGQLTEVIWGNNKICEEVSF